MHNTRLLFICHQTIPNAATDITQEIPISVESDSYEIFYDTAFSSRSHWEFYQLLKERFPNKNFTDEQFALDLRGYVPNPETEEMQNMFLFYGKYFRVPPFTPKLQQAICEIAGYLKLDITDDRLCVFGGMVQTKPDGLQHERCYGTLKHLCER